MNTLEAQFAIGGLQNPEDLAIISGSEWVITSAMSEPNVGEAQSSFINMRTHEVRPAYPVNCEFELDVARFGDVSPPDAIQFHGLDVVLNENGTHTLYQVNHPLWSGSASDKGVGRESVEVFEIDLKPNGPSLRWIGGVVSPSYVFGNEVCGLPEGGFALTNICSGGPTEFSSIASGGISGHVLEWHDRDTGWRVVEGTDVNAPNGIAISLDGEFYFIASWASMEFHRISRTDPHGSRKTVFTGALLDNITWTPDGSLLVAGQLSNAIDVMNKVTSGHNKLVCPFQAIKIHPETLEVTTLFTANPGDRTASTVLQVNDHEVWTSAGVTDEVLVYKL
jgi:hypothetical protein